MECEGEREWVLVVVVGFGAVRAWIQTKKVYGTTKVRDLGQELVLLRYAE